MTCYDATLVGLIAGKAVPPPPVTVTAQRREPEPTQTPATPSLRKRLGSFFKAAEQPPVDQLAQFRASLGDAIDTALKNNAPPHIVAANLEDRARQIRLRIATTSRGV